MSSSSVSEFQWLLEDEAAKLLTLAQNEFAAQSNPLKIAKLLRKSTSPTRAAMVMEQAQLRIRAASKFSLAEQMFFTQRGLEQSSGPQLASYKTKKFSECDRVVDVCCGIGGDLLALAARDPSVDSIRETVGVDNDEVTAMFARRNLELHLAHAGLSDRQASVQHTDFGAITAGDFSGLHFDPDRRRGRRTIDGRHFSPSLVDVFKQVSDQQIVAVKVAPATPMDDYLPAAIHREWIGDKRECKQQVLWLGSDHRPAGNSATLVTDDGQSHSIDCDGRLSHDRVLAPKLKKYLYEPHAVVLAAKLEDHLAAKHGLERISFDIPYFVSETLVDDPLLSKFQVVELMKLDFKTVQSFVTVNDIGQIELKQRGIDNVTFERFKKLKLNGTKRATLCLTRYGEQEKRRVIVAKRLDG